MIGDPVDDTPRLVGDPINYDCLYGQSGQTEEEIRQAARIDRIAQNGNDGLHYDMVANPKHYQLIPEKGVQVIDVIRAVLTEEEFRGYCRGNQIKYQLRNKADRKEDAGKCRQYIDFELEQ